MKRFIGASILLALLLSVAQPSTALQLPEGIQEQLTVDITPTDPGPNQDVTITVRSYSTNLGGASIAWFVNGALMLNERGATSFSLRTGEVGTQTEVVVRITKAEGGEVARVITFAPADLELVFEPDTYTPPFYKGRSVYSHQAPYKVVAIPRFIGLDGTRYSERDLVYTWRINGRYVEGAGGLGGNVLTTKGALVSRPFDVSVDVATPDGTLGARESVYITPSPARVVLYENSALYGVLYNNALDSEFDLGTEKEFTATAAPYFFGVSAPDVIDLIYKWTIDGRIVIMPSNENDLTVRVPDGEGLSGSNPIYVEARHKTDVLQAGYTATTITFDNSN